MYENSQFLLNLFEKSEKNTDIFASHKNEEGSRGVAPLPKLKATILRKGFFFGCTVI